MRDSEKNVESAIFHTEFGIVGDAHAGDWHRQVSFLGKNAIENFSEKVNFGAFGENIVAEGFNFKNLPIGTRLKSGEVIFEITQIGKKCHDKCEIYKKVGDCIMPREGIFGRVLHGGEIKIGDELEIFTEKMKLDAAIIVCSDTRDEKTDKSGEKILEILTENNYKVYEKMILPDEKKILSEKMIEYANLGIGLILTTGGT